MTETNAMQCKMLSKLTQTPLSQTIPFATQNATSREHCVWISCTDDISCVDHSAGSTN